MKENKDMRKEEAIGKVVAEGLKGLLGGILLCSIKEEEHILNVSKICTNSILSIISLCESERKEDESEEQLNERVSSEFEAVAFCFNEASKFIKEVGAKKTKERFNLDVENLERREKEIEKIKKN